MSALPTNPYDKSRYVGTVVMVSPDRVLVNFPYSTSAGTKNYAGFAVAGGQVGEFVFVEGEKFAVLGRIVEIRLPERERLDTEPGLGVEPVAHPIGTVQLLTTLELSAGGILSGIPEHPRIGQHVYSAHPLLLQHVVQGDTSDEPQILLAATGQETTSQVSISPQQLFGRHCAVLGATGGGKSWTVARIVQEAARVGGKIILVDPTGEFHPHKDGVQHVHLGAPSDEDRESGSWVSFPYWHLTELDLFAIFQPSNASQAPKLREAVRTLKLMHETQGGEWEGPFVKAKGQRKEFNRLWAKNETAVSAPGAKYKIEFLARQIMEECVQDTDFKDPSCWGTYDERVKGYCETLVAKVWSLIRSRALQCLFAPSLFGTSLVDEIDSFLTSDNHVLRVSMASMPFENNARELIVNCIGRHLLTLARDGAFSDYPVVVVLDEAHQFLNRQVGDEALSVKLDAFGVIAKEGRKYGLTTVIATQRPRDVPEDVLSQMGMFVVHRLINERDRQIVESACGNLDRSAAQFLPTLGQGEAILVGADFPMPTPVRILMPQFPPESSGPSYHRWSVDPVSKHSSNLTANPANPDE